MRIGTGWLQKLASFWKRRSLKGDSNFILVELLSIARMVAFRGRGHNESKKLAVDYVINCTGPDENCQRVNSPLLKDLLNQKLVRPDPLFLGLDANESGALVEASGVMFT